MLFVTSCNSTRYIASKVDDLTHWATTQWIMAFYAHVGVHLEEEDNTASVLVCVIPWCWPWGTEDSGEEDAAWAEDQRHHCVCSMGPHHNTPAQGKSSMGFMRYCICKILASYISAMYVHVTSTEKLNWELFQMLSLRAYRKIILTKLIIITFCTCFICFYKYSKLFLP